MRDEFEHGIELFNRGEYFASHEALEVVWTPERGPRRRFLQALIHFAVGFYHHQRGNPVGRDRQFDKGVRKLSDYLPEYGGVDTERLLREMAAWRADEAAERPSIHFAMALQSRESS